MMNRKIIILSFFLILCTGLRAQRMERTLNDGWRFYSANDMDASSPEFDDSVWEKVSLPHSWNKDAYTVKNYYRGEAWYRRGLTLPKEESGRSIFLRFEGINHSAEVFVNGHSAGTHRGGYTAFTVEITGLCRVGEENVIAVRADNSEGFVPTISGDFTMFGGIYRDAWLITVPEQHIDLSDNGSDGVFITTPVVSETQAQWQVRTSVRNDSPQAAAISVTFELWSASGRSVGTVREEAVVPAHGHHLFSTDPQQLLNPELWSPEMPNRYRVETILRDGSGKELDRVTAHTGFRWFSVDPALGFFLNGKPYKLNGVCRHQDQYPVANALTDEMHRRDMQLIKEMGANFIRISHYPQDPAILEMCDRLGLLAWEEIPLIDVTHPDPRYGEIAHSMLREMIRQHYNHPSIVMWGYMNEILLRGSATVAGERVVQDRPAILALAESLEEMLREEDPYRLSTMAFHGSTTYYDAGLGNLTDIIGWNLYSGWYGGELSGFDRFLERQHTEHPDRPILVSEYGAGSDRRLHTLEPRCFDFSIEYQQAYLEHYLPVIDRYPYVLGGALWNFIDFGSASRDESMPRINNKGIVYNDRTPKDVYYLYQASFRKDISVLYLATRDWEDRVWSGDGVVQHPIKIYTNLQEVELFVNGISQGVQRAENHTVNYTVPMETGHYDLEVRGTYHGETVRDCFTVRSTVIPEKLTPENIEGLELAVNVGSNCSYRMPASGLTWVADRAYRPGEWGYVGGEVYASAGHTIGTQTQITGTLDNPLYQTLRENPEEYRFDVPDGQYEVELLFADVFDRGTAVAHQLGMQEGERSYNAFTVRANGKTLEVSLSLSEAPGYYQAVRKRYLIRCSGGEGLRISFETLTGKSFLNGIKIRKI